MVALSSRGTAQDRMFSTQYHSPHVVNCVSLNRGESKTSAVVQLAVSKPSKTRKYKSDEPQAARRLLQHTLRIVYQVRGVRREAGAIINGATISASNSTAFRWLR